MKELQYKIEPQSFLQNCYEGFVKLSMENANTHTDRQINKQANKNKTHKNKTKTDIKECNPETNACSTKMWRLGKGIIDLGSFLTSSSFPI